MFARIAVAAVFGIAAFAPVNAAVTVDYALYSLGNYTEQGGSRIGGGVAVAGNARINSATIGASLGADRNDTTVVAVGGTLSYDNSTLSHGNVVYAGANTSGTWTQAQTPGGSFTQGNALDFARINSGLLGLSASYAAMAVTGGLTTQWGAGTLTGASTVGTDVFSLTTDQLGGVYSLSLIGAAGSKAIINVTGLSFGSYFSFNAGHYAVSDVVFNFVDASNVGLNGINLAGSILAPLATISQQGGRIAGRVVAGNYSSGGAEIGGEGQWALAGEPSGAVPEPGTWAMLGSGFALVGAAMRRRQKAAAVLQVA